MSRENVEVVGRAVEAWQRDDRETWLSLYDPAIEWRTERLVEDAGSARRGIDGIRGLWTVWRTEADDFEVEFQKPRDLGDDRILQLGRARWRRAAKGIVVESPLGIVVTLRDGKIVRAVDYLSHREALEAVGLSE
jgi:ketosteroid isomerase-like protein